MSIGVQIPETVNARHSVRRTITMVGRAAFSGNGSALVALLENDVDDARDGVGAVHGGSAVLQHFDALDCVKRNIGHVDERALTIVADWERRHAMAIDQHQGGTDIQSAQRDPGSAAGECA